MPPYYDTPEMQQGRLRDVQRLNNWLRARYNPDNYIAVAYRYYRSLWNQLWNENTEDNDGNCPEYPGDDPTAAPEGFEWKGKPGSQPGGKEGNYHNPETGESLRPDLDHNPPVGPHWDYKDPNGNWHRLYPDGSVIPK